jgi:uncharacterized protein YndB with AHSA1/START domain
MQEVIVERVIDAPRERVWQVYTDHVSWQDWSSIGKVRLETEGVPAPNGVGCVRVISNRGIAAYEEVVSWDPPERMTYRVVKGGLPMRGHLGEVDFSEEAGGRTRIVWRCRFDSKIPGLGPLFAVIVRKVFRDTLAALGRYDFKGEAG